MYLFESDLITRNNVGFLDSHEEPVVARITCTLRDELGKLVLHMQMDWLPGIQMRSLCFHSCRACLAGKAGTPIAYVNDSFWELVQELQYLKYERPRLFRGQPRILSSNACMMSLPGLSSYQPRNAWK